MHIAIARDPEQKRGNVLWPEKRGDSRKQIILTGAITAAVAFTKKFLVSEGSF